MSMWVAGSSAASIEYAVTFSDGLSSGAASSGSGTPVRARKIAGARAAAVFRDGFFMLEVVLSG